MTTPLTISADGTTWNLHRAGVDPIEFCYENEDGTQADISSDSVTFKVAGGPNIVMVTDPANATGLRLVFTLADLAAIPVRGADFRVKNETTGQVYLDGKVFTRGIA